MVRPPDWHSRIEGFFLFIAAGGLAAAVGFLGSLLPLGVGMFLALFKAFGSRLWLKAWGVF